MGVTVSNLGHFCNYWRMQICRENRIDWSGLICWEIHLNVNVVCIILSFISGTVITQILDHAMINHGSSYITLMRHVYVLLTYGHMSRSWINIVLA